MKRLLLSTSVLLLCIFMAEGQVSENLTEVYKSSAARFYTYNYPSKDASGKDVVLSSMLIAWSPGNAATTDSIESLHIYSHYTITANRECPTSESNSQDRMLFGYLVKNSYGLASDRTSNFISRSVVIAPDYQGYGVSHLQSHPYLAQELTARQVMDGVEYGLKLYQRLIAGKQALPFKSDWRTFAYGYSQGGAVTLAVHRYIEENGLSDDLRFRGSICGDGPYDLLATLRYYIEDDGTSYGTTTKHRKGLSTMPMVIPMIIKGMLDTHPDMKGHSLEDYLSQQLLDTGIMEWLAGKEMTTGDISKKWYQQLLNGLDANGRHYTPQQMAELFETPGVNDVWARIDKVFTPGLYAYLTNPETIRRTPTEHGDVWQDIHRALLANSLADGWEPRHRIQFVHSTGDTVVPFANYLSFRDAHPAGEGEIYRVDESLSPSDHSSAGTSFFAQLTVMGSYAKYFKWLDEPLDVDGIRIPEMSIADERNDSWYTLDGRRLDSRPSRKGLYIHRGRKVAIGH